MHKEERPATHLPARVIAVLSAAGHPLKINKLKELCDIHEPIENVLREAGEILHTTGLTIITSGESVEIATHPDMEEYTEKMLDSDIPEELGKASQETLSIILYRSPVTKEEVDYLRGVNSSQALRQLEILGLVEARSKEGKKVYEPTTEALKKLGVATIKDLPHYLEVQQEIDNHMELTGMNDGSLA